MIDLLGRGTFFQQELGLVRVELQHAVADETVGIPGEHRHLAETLAELHHRDDRLRRAAFAAHVLEQLHDIGRAEEMRADHILRPGGSRCDGVDIQ